MTEDLVSFQGGWEEGGDGRRGWKEGGRVFKNIARGENVPLSPKLSSQEMSQLD